MPTTTNFGWTTPADTDLVKDGALAIRTLGNGIDTSLVDLKGGTTGQVLSKASNTDMDFTWVAVDPLTILDAKGDLISATAADTPARLAVGTNGQVLTADSTTSTGLKWATPAGGGKVLQVVSSLITSSATISSTTLTDTNITATITPTSATSKILILISANVHVSRTAQPANYGASLLRGATEIYDMNNNTYSGVGYAASYTTSSTGSNWGWASYVPTIYLDSPSTTSATTYKLQANCEVTASSSTIIYQEWAGSTITLMEIGA